MRERKCVPEYIGARDAAVTSLQPLSGYPALAGCGSAHGLFHSRQARFTRRACLGLGRNRFRAASRPLWPEPALPGTPLASGGDAPPVAFAPSYPRRAAASGLLVMFAMKIDPIDRVGRRRLANQPVMRGMPRAVANRGLVQETKAGTRLLHVTPHVLIHHRCLIL